MVREMPARGGQQIRETRRLQALATRLADFARTIRALAWAELADAGPAPLHALYQQARAEILPDLAREDFVDLLAQVLVYCCLLARRSSQEKYEPFARTLRVFQAQPGLPPFVQRLLTMLCLPLLRKQQAAFLGDDAERRQRELLVGVKDLVAFLSTTDIQALLEKLRPACLQGDPLIYFYELFLAAYAPHQRSQRGVYYTPAPVIAYMVKAIDELLRGAFAYPDGLAGALQNQDQRGGVFLCDPACGTGAFLWAVLDHVSQAYRASGQATDWLSALLASTQSCLTGCEIMPVAYLLACIELTARQAELGLPGDERARRAVAPAQCCSSVHSCISLVNTLAHARPFALSADSLPVILGNPPYAGHSLNHSDWLGHLLEDYKTGDAGLKKPAQTKWLSDDYVQFLRVAQWQIEQAGRGIVAFLTSHSYLDNPTFRAMRLSLLRSFDEIYILDLHGNSKRRERAPDGGRDRNIFTIQQGIAIGIFVKRDAGQLEERLATVHHADVWGAKAVYTADKDGTRHLSGGKLGWLASHDLSNTPWQISHPVAPFYLFTPRSDSYQAEYMAYWSLPAIFAPNGDPAPGLVTCHDEFAISWTAAEAAAKIATLLATSDEAEARRLFHLCMQGQWDYAAARHELCEDNWRGELGRIHYRPFDTRWTVFERHVAVHLRERITRHMRAGPNLALAVGRAGQVIDGGDNWDIAFCSNLPTEFNLYRRGGNYLFPLYLYSPSSSARAANLAPQFSAEISQRLTLRWLPDGRGDLYATFGPDDIFAYIYALLYSPGYRARYADFLKIDFPRLPLPTQVELFRSLCLLGRELSQAHLLEQPLATESAWARADDNLVAHVRYRADQRGSGCLSINERQHLDHVPSAVWALTIGGYQVAKKWLWDRRGRQLTSDELAYYCQIIASLTCTLELMEAIDSAIEQHGGWPLL
jgi:hypothetical protein